METLRTIRKRCGIPVKRLAEQLGVSRAAIYNWEEGATAPNVAHLQDLAAIYNLTVDELLAIITGTPAKPYIPPHFSMLLQWDEGTHYYTASLPEFEMRGCVSGKSYGEVAEAATRLLEQMIRERPMLPPACLYGQNLPAHSETPTGRRWRSTTPYRAVYPSDDEDEFSGL